MCVCFFEMGSVCLSRSGKAVLFFPGDGSAWVTSVKFLRLLLDGELKGNLLVLSELGGAVDNGVGGVRPGRGGRPEVKPPSGGEVLL